MISNLHILCAGRDQTLLQTRRWILEALYQVDIADSVKAAGGKIAANQLDLVILCYTLTDEERQQICKLAREKNSSTKILSLLSSNVRPNGNGDGGKVADEELVTDGGPRGLLKKTLEMLH